MRIFGLTGGLAAGKSTVAARFRVLGIPIIDADQLAREAVAPGSAALHQIGHVFGHELITAAGKLDRGKLGARVFGDPAALAQLNAIVHPRVAELFRAECKRLESSGHPLVGYEVPLLFENGLDARLRPIVVVTAPQALQVERAIQRNGWSREHVLARLASQMPLAEKVARADYVVNTDGPLSETERQVDVIAAELRSLPREVTGSQELPGPTRP